MYLTPGNVPYYLMERGLIEPSDIVSGDFAVMEVGRRNRNFKVMRKKDRSLFIKQISDGRRSDFVSTLTREASFYQLVETRPQFSSLKKMTPQYCDFDPERLALTVEMKSNGETLNEHHFKLRSYPVYAGELMGRGLAGYHTLTDTIFADPGYLTIFPRQLPWILNLHPLTLSPLEQFGDLGRQMMDILGQYPILTQFLQTLAGEYRYDALVHGDIKWDNFIIFADGDHTWNLQIIDWELTDIGDACWDLAAVFTAYVMYLLMVQPGMPGTAEGELRGDIVIEQAQPSLRRFWLTYTRLRQMDDQTSAAYLDRCMLFCAGRLVMGVFEALFNVSPLTRYNHLVMKTAQDILTNPRAAAAGFLGESI